MSAHRYLGKCQAKYGGCGTGLAMNKDSHESHLWVTCPHCRKRALLKRVQGEYNPGHKCDPRCTGATGFECSCACGGANHGADHDMQEVVVAASRTPATVDDFKPRPVSTHLGEVGKHITGMVTIRSKRPLSGDKTLYTFVSDGGDTIKWFVPGQYDPAWAEGEHFKMRAKVTRHEDHETFGKATIVIFCEKVDE